MLEINQIYCGAAEHILSNSIDNNVIDLTLVSPPYDDLRSYTKESAWDFNIFKLIVQELYRITKDGGVIVWVVGDATIKGNETGTSFKQALYFQEIGFNLHDTMIYEKHNFSMPATNRYHQMFEFMFVFVKGKLKTFNPIMDRKNKYVGQTTWGKNQKWGKDELISWDCKEYKEYGMRGNIWKYITTGSYPNQKKWKHPAKFPEQLAIDHILSWTNENNLVLDPMCGSGTTCKIAKQLKRNYIGIDCSEEYVKMSIERLKNV